MAEAVLAFTFLAIAGAVVWSMLNVQEPADG